MNTRQRMPEQLDFLVDKRGLYGRHNVSLFLNECEKKLKEIFRWEHSIGSEATAQNVQSRSKSEHDG